MSKQRYCSKCLAQHRQSPCSHLHQDSHKQPALICTDRLVVSVQSCWCACLFLRLFLLLCRSMTPSLLALLQHPAEARRAFAAEYASLLGTQASGVVVSALLSSDSCLSTLLKRLSGDDKPASRSHYARLIACCAAHQACDAAVLKKISDSGAVPYLLRLLKEIEGSDQKFRVVYCLEVIPPTNSVHLITLCVCVCVHDATAIGIQSVGAVDFHTSPNLH